MRVSMPGETALTWWQCKYCYVITVGEVVTECALCANRVIDCGDFALRVRDERQLW